MLKAVWDVVKSVEPSTWFAAGSALIGTVGTIIGTVSTVRSSNDREKINELSKEVEIQKKTNNELKKEMNKLVKSNLQEPNKTINLDGPDEIDFRPRSSSMRAKIPKSLSKISSKSVEEGDCDESGFSNSPSVYI